VTTRRPVDVQAASRLQTLRDSLGTWRKVGAFLGVNQGDCVHVVKGTRRANAKMLKALGLVKPRKPTISLPLTRGDAREILDYATFPDSARERLLKIVVKYDQRTQRPGGA